VRHTELLVEFPKKAERFYILSFITLALGLMSKPMLVTWPLVMLLLDFWPLKRISQEDPRGCFPVISKLVIEKLPLFALSCISSYMAFIAQKGAGALLESLSFTQRLANALISYERYLVKTFIPQDLAVFYPHPGSWPVGQIALAMLVIVAITGLVIWLIRKAPYLAFGWAWFLGTLVPVIGLVQAGHQAMADRYSYLPLIGIFIMLVWGLKELLSRQSWRGPVLAIASVAVLVVCAILTRIQLQYWKNSITLFERAVTSTGGSVLAHVNLGDAYLQQNKVAEAMGQFTQALNLDKNDFAGHVGMANALVNLGKNAEALSHYQAAINTNPKSFDIHHALGLTYQRLGKLEEAAAHYQECNKIQPHYMPAIMSMAQVFLIAGKPGEAEKAYRYVLQNQPGFIDAYLALSSLLFQQGKADEAYKTLFAATTLAPKSAAVRLQMADLLIALKRKPEALAEYRTALLINPDFTIALNNLAWVLASDSDVSIRNGQEAVKLAQKANALTGNKLPVFLGTLAAAYAECGQFSEAIAIADKAVKQSDAAGDKKLAATNQKLLDLYRAGKPVRQ
jgi:tetratricopeptide (TPR) repeat protein